LVPMTFAFKLSSMILALVLAGAAAAAPAAKPAKPLQPVKILALGTSLTQGYGLPPGSEFTVQLQDALNAAGLNVTIENAGVSGDTSAGGVARLDWSLADHPKAVILELGSNDMLRGTPPAETEKNLRAILNRLKAAHVPVLLVGMKAQRNLGQDYVAAFDGIYPRLAKEYRTLFYPFLLDGVALNPKLNQADGMHPTAEGVEVIVKKMLPTVEAFLGTIRGPRS